MFIRYASAQERRWIKVQFIQDIKGQGLVEYAMIMLLVALLVIVILALLGPAVGNMYSEVVPKI